MSRAPTAMLILLTLHAAALGVPPAAVDDADRGAPLDALSHDASWDRAFEAEIAPVDADARIESIAAGEFDSRESAAAPDAPPPIAAAVSSEPRGEQVLARRGQRASGAVRASSASGASPDWLRTFVSLGAVIGLILLLAWGYRSFAASQSGMLLRARRPGVIDMVGRVNIGPKQSLCLVRVGSRMVLVGVTAERIAALDVIADPAVTAQLAGVERDLQTRTEFSESLEFEARGIEQAEAELESPMPKKGFPGLHDRLAETLRRLKRSAVKVG